MFCCEPVTTMSLSSAHCAFSHSSNLWGPKLVVPLAPSVKNMTVVVTATSFTPSCCFKVVASLEKNSHTVSLWDYGAMQFCFRMTYKGLCLTFKSVFYTFHTKCNPFTLKVTHYYNTFMPMALFTADFYLWLDKKTLFFTEGLQRLSRRREKARK